MYLLNFFEPSPMAEEKVEPPGAEKMCLFSSFLFFLDQINTFYKIHISAPREPRFAICKVQVFISIQPNPNNLFSSENQDFTNHPLSVPPDQAKYSNPRIKKNQFFYEQNQFGRRKIQLLSENSKLN